MALPKHKKCVFDQETFFDITTHPQVKRFSKQEFYDMIADSGLDIEKAGLWDRIAGKSPVEIVSEPNNINVEVDTNENDRETEKRSDSSEKTFQKDGPEQEFPGGSDFRTEKSDENIGFIPKRSIPFSEQSANEGNDEQRSSVSGDGITDSNYTRFELSDEAWKTVIGIFFKYLFKIISAKTGSDMELEPDELEDLERVTMPLVNKYGMFDMKYAQELTFIATILIIIFKKHLVESVSEIIIHKKTEKEVFADDEIKGNGKMNEKNAENFVNNLDKQENQETLVGGIYKLFEDNKEKMLEVPIRDITEDEFTMCQEFVLMMEPDREKLEISEAKGIIHFVEFSGMKLTDLIGAVKACGPSIFQSLLDKVKNGPS